MKNLCLTLLISFTLFQSLAQSITIKGIIKDSTTLEPLVGASIKTDQGGGARSNLKGEFLLELAQAKSLTLSCTYTGYQKKQIFIPSENLSQSVVILLSPIENTLNTIELPEEGWVVKKENLYKWFDEYLPKLGLNEKEKIQLKEYWMYELLDSEYYEIKLFSNNFLNANMKLNVTPKPDSVIRLIFNFKEVTNLYEIKNTSKKSLFE